MNIVNKTTTLSGARVALISALFIVLSACGRDAGKAASIALRGALTPTAAPSASPYTFRPGNRLDTDSQGGSDDAQTHATSSGITVTNGNLGSTFEHVEATSAQFKVQGGVYVQ